MRSVLFGLGGLPFVLVLSLALPRSVEAQTTRVVSGVVVDADSGAPVADAVITIAGTSARAVTDEEGRFEIGGVPVGERRLVLDHLAYGAHEEPLAVEAGGSLDFRILVSTRAIELAPLLVEVASAEERARRASGGALNVIDRAMIEAHALGGQGLLPLLASRVPGLRVEGGCVEYRRQQAGVFRDPDTGASIVVPCRDITVYVDGVPDARGSARLSSIPPEDIERIQVLSPSEAGVRHLAPGRGVILVELRQGVASESPPRVLVTGFGWNEPDPYPLWRVLGISTLSSVAIAGLMSRGFSGCGQGEVDWHKPARCTAVAGVSAAVVTGGIGRLLVGSMGRTSYSEGRTYPTLLLGALTASLGYALVLRGENEHIDASRTAGYAVLAVGVPLSLTLADRVFRVLR